MCIEIPDDGPTARQLTDWDEHNAHADGADDGDEPGASGVFLTREQLEAWAGRRLSDDDLGRLDEAIPNSSIPEAIDAIVASFD